MFFQSYRGLLYARLCSYGDDGEQEGKVLFHVAIFVLLFLSYLLLIYDFFAILQSLKSFLDHDSV